MTCCAELEPAFCDGCGLAAGSPPYATSTIQGIEIAVCSEACLEAVSDREMQRITCLYCGLLTPVDDRLRATSGGHPGVAHTECLELVTRKLGIGIVDRMKQRRLAVLPGGQS